MEAKFMSKKSAILVALALAGVLGTPAFAAGVGTTGAQFLKVGVGARPLAMGGAFSALPDDANAINWNPGALGAIPKQSVTASYNSLFQDQRQGFLGYVKPLSDDMGTIGAGVNYMTVGKIEKRVGDTESADSTFSNQNFAMIASYGKKASDSLSVGGNIKYIRETFDTFSGNAVALDLGTLYKTSMENLTLGGSLKNFGSKIGSDPLPLTVKGGAAYKLWSQKLVLAADLDWLAVDQKVYGDLGTELWLNRVLALRAGYQAGRGTDQLGSKLVGFGFGLGIWLEQFRLDYGFIPFGNLGDTHRITLGWNF
ncbi:MAG: hypothetical protein A3J70_02225 [Elusimicrobia bacterium RIFCSPHIGHO2_02_FULL_61_10]|nr:MAG: hypothetical protein A3J70_02225 [Elusimicrobia bacterium RIFCSPHIGHO2_02_FULL_61_10]